MPAYQNESLHRTVAICVGAVSAALFLMAACEGIQAMEATDDAYKAECVKAGSSYLTGDQCIVTCK